MPEVIIHTCRLVNGHPMRRSQVIDKNTKQPLKAVDGTPVTDMYMGLAIPKNPGVDWKQEPWGQIMVAEAMLGWPNGEFNALTFAWKVVDGDSAIPNSKNKIPNTRPGYPGHWVLNCSTQWTVSCFHIDKYDPLQQIQNMAEIKPGDHGMAVLNIKHNNPAESPGVYVNPTSFVLARPGEAIILESGTTAAQAFGGAAGAQQQAPPQQQQQAPPQNTQIQPANSFLDPQAAAAAAANGAGQQQAPPPPQNQAAPPPPPAENFLFNGAVWTREQLTASQWTPEAINALPRA